MGKFKARGKRSGRKERGRLITKEMARIREQLQALTTGGALKSSTLDGSTHSQG